MVVFPNRHVPFPSYSTQPDFPVAMSESGLWMSEGSRFFRRTTSLSIDRRFWKGRQFLEANLSLWLHMESCDTPRPICFGRRLPSPRRAFRCGCTMRQTISFTGLRTESESGPNRRFQSHFPGTNRQLACVETGNLFRVDFVGSGWGGVLLCGLAGGA